MASTVMSEVDLRAIKDTFAQRGLVLLHKLELVIDDDVAQILSQNHNGFGVWLGELLHHKECEQFVAVLRGVPHFKGMVSIFRV